MSYSTIVPPEALRANIARPEWVIFDCRFHLADPDAGRDQWLRSRIPGAAYADLERDLSGPPGPGSGRHPLPDRAHLARWIAAHGVEAGVQVVAYDADHGAFAARLWWLLHWLGHRDVAVLDGGFAAWQALGFPIETGAPSGWLPDKAEPPEALGRPGGTATVSAASLARENGWLVIDARAVERFRGEHEPVDPVAGHVPGAVNRPFLDNLDADRRFRSPESLHAEWMALLGAWAPSSVVHMCGSGVTAAHNQLAMVHAGLHGSRLYPGSWSEWITDPARPVATGP